MEDAHAWEPVDPVIEGDFRKAGIVEVLDTDGTLKLACYDKSEGCIDYPDDYPNWRPTHWRRCDQSNDPAIR